MVKEDKVNITWEADGKGNVTPDLDFGGEQICLRCNKRPALKDGSDEGEYYCKECIETRKEVDAINFKENKIKEEKFGKLKPYKDSILSENFEKEEEDKD